MTALLLLGGADRDLAAPQPVMCRRADLLFAPPRAPWPLLPRITAAPAGVTRPVFDAVGPSSAGASQTGTATPFTWSHTCSGSNRILFVGVCVSPTASDAGISLSVTYAGTAMTPLLQRHSFDQTSGYAQLFYLIAPATSTNTVSVAITGNSGLEGLEGGSISFTGADQSAPIGATTTAAGNSASATATLSSSSAAVVVDLTAAGSVVSNTNQTNAWTDNRSSNSGAGNGGMGYANGAASVTFTRTLTADWWAELTAEVLGVSGTSPTPPPVTVAPALSRPAAAAAVSVLVSRDVTPLQPSAWLPLPDITAVPVTPQAAPAAILTRPTADSQTGTPPPPAVVTAPPVPALAVQAVQALMRAEPLPVTPLPTPDIPATAGIWPQPAPRPVLLATPGSPVTAPDAIPCILAIPAGLWPQTAPSSAVFAVRADTPLQASSQPPILAVIPAGYARPPQGGQTIIRSTSEPTDPVVGLKLNVTPAGVVLALPAPVPVIAQVRDVTPLQASASPPAPVVALAGYWPSSAPRALVTYSTADQVPSTALPAVLVASAGIQAPSAARPLTVQAPATPVPADGLRRILAVPVLRAMTAAARVLLGRSPFDPVTPPIVRPARADAGTRRGPAAGAGTRTGSRADAGTRRAARGDAGTRQGTTGTAGRKRSSGADGGP